MNSYSRIHVLLASILILWLGALRAHCTPVSADTASINKLLKVADKVLNPDSGIALFDEAYEASKKADYPNGAVIALITKGIKYYEKEDYAKMRSCCLQALPWAERSTRPDDVAWCYNNIGDAYFSEGDYTHASQYFYTALRELKKRTDAPNHTAANIYNNLGSVNIRLGQPEKALAYYNLAEQISVAGKLDYQLAGTYDNKGLYYVSIRKPDSAIYYFAREKELGLKMGKHDAEAMADIGIAKAEIVQGRYADAAPLLKHAIETAGTHYPYIHVDGLVALGTALYHLGDYRNAESLLTKALNEIKLHNIKDNLPACYQTLIDVYKATGQYQKALAYSDTLSALKDSLTSAEKAQAVNQMEIKYQTAEKDKQIAQGELLIARQKSNITAKNTWMVIIASGIFIVVLVSVGLYRNSVHKQHLQAEVIKSLQQQNIIDNLKGMVEGEERERGRIARELHDGIGGILSAAMMRFVSVRHEDAQVVKMQSFKDGMTLLDNMGDEIRKTAHNLMPDTLAKQSLPDALRGYCNSLQQNSSLTIDFQAYGDYTGIPGNIKLNVYRIVQELLKNIFRHAQAGNALVQLMILGQLLTVTVEDNGKGFDTQRKTDGMGLQNIETRVLSMNGHFTIKSGAGGTSVYIEIELPQNETV